MYEKIYKLIQKHNFYIPSPHLFVMHMQSTCIYFDIKNQVIYLKIQETFGYFRFYMYKNVQ